MDRAQLRDARDGTPDRAPAATAPSPARGHSRWVPIRRLGAQHRARILDHLLRLGEHDRHLRFGYAASDAQIADYAAQMDFERDELFGIFNRRLHLVGLAHLAYLAGTPPRAAEFGVSVARPSRGRGYGDRLFEHAALHARNRGVDHLLVHALSENAAMLHILHKAGARIERDGAESRAWVGLPPASLASRVEALVEDTAAGLDYGLKHATLSAANDV